MPFEINIHYKHITKRLFWAISVMLVLAVLSYAYFLNATVTNVVERKEVKQKVTDYNTKLSEVEFTYIQLQNKVTLKRARNMGFRQVENPRYVTQGEAGPTLTLSTSR